MSASLQVPLTSLLLRTDAQIETMYGPYVKGLVQQIRKNARFFQNGTPPEQLIEALIQWSNNALGQIYGKTLAEVEAMYEVPGTMANLTAQSVNNGARAGIEPVLTNAQRVLQAVQAVGVGAPTFTEIIQFPDLATSKDWIDPSGNKLAQRILQVGRDSSGQIESVLRYEMKNGIDPDLLTKKLQAFLSTRGDKSRKGKPGGFDGIHQARRLLRTETARAHGMGVVTASRLDPYNKGVKWNLGFAHPGPDECDANASNDNYSLGRGVYPTGRVPTYPNHPNCLCFLSNITTSPKILAERAARVPGPDLTQLSTDELVEHVTGFKPTTAAPAPSAPKAPKRVSTPRSTKKAATHSVETLTDKPAPTAATKQLVAAAKPPWQPPTPIEVEKRRLTGMGIHDPAEIPAASLDDAAKYARKLGMFKVTYGKGATLDMANLANSGFYQLKIRGIEPPPNFSLEAENFTVRGFSARSTAGEYNFAQRTMRLNPKSDVMRNPKEMMATQAKYNNWSSSDVHHIIYHEVGHKEHQSFAGNAVLSDLQKKIRPYYDPNISPKVRKEVSQYGMTSPLEYVAEVFAGHIAGRKWSQEVLNGYYYYRGPRLP